MSVGIIYFFIIVFANTIGAVSGMGGGVLIKPMLDLIHVHPVAAISFYSSVAVLTMSFVSTYRQVKNGIEVKWPFAIRLSLGAVLGGLLGNYLFEWILKLYPEGREVQLVQIILTVITLLLSIIHSYGLIENRAYQGNGLTLISGLVLGFLASLLGIGGGPINVALLMFLFDIPIKRTTVYSIITILFSQLTKVTSIFIVSDITRFDLAILYYIIPAAIIGGLLGAFISKKASDKSVNVLYQAVIILVLLLNIYNGLKLI